MFCVTETPRDVRVEALLSGSEGLEMDSAISAGPVTMSNRDGRGGRMVIRRVQETYQYLMS